MMAHRDAPLQILIVDDNPEDGWPYKAGQHILYLFGKLSRLANDLPAQLMATATRG
jgi:hypothetical protein